MLTGEDKSRLLARDGHNIVAVDLPHIPPKDAGPDAAYEAAVCNTRLLRTWLEDGILVQDEKPALYAYQQTYTHNKITYKRAGMIFTRVRLEEFGEDSSIHPHYEQTFLRGLQGRPPEVDAGDAGEPLADFRAL